MSEGVKMAVAKCEECAKERVRERKRDTYLKLFPATTPLEEVAIDIMGELTQTPRGNRFILVITDRFSKLVRVAAMKQVRAIDVAKAFTRDCVFTYGPPWTILSDNGPQFVARLTLEVYRILGIRDVFTTTYHPETNGQTERYNKTLASALRKFYWTAPDGLGPLRGCTGVRLQHASSRVN